MLFIWALAIALLRFGKRTCLLMYLESFVLQCYLWDIWLLLLSATCDCQCTCVIKSLVHWLWPVLSTWGYLCLPDLLELSCTWFWHSTMHLPLHYFVLVVALYLRQTWVIQFTWSLLVITLYLYNSWDFLCTWVLLAVTLFLCYCRLFLCTRVLLVMAFTCVLLGVPFVPESYLRFLCWRTDSALLEEFLACA